MKIFNALALAMLVLSVACSDDETEVHSHQTSGTVTLMFDNFAGHDDLILEDYGSDNYNLTNALDQTFNISLMGYYISEIQLLGSEGLLYEDSVSASAETSHGFYHIVEDINGVFNHMISFQDVPMGSYNQIRFKLGVSGDVVQEGAQGGILNPGNSSTRFWNWNAGYVAFKIEGNSAHSGSEDGIMKFHVGGWATPNNVKEITIDLSTPLVVGDESSSMAHIAVDALNAFAGHMNIDFGMTYSIHSPSAGEHMAHNLEGVFSVHHVENDFHAGHGH